MIKITCYEALGYVHVTIDAIRVVTGDEPTRPTTSSLHYSCHPSHDVPDTESLARVVADALEHANGYAGDLMDHVMA